MQQILTLCSEAVFSLMVSLPGIVTPVLESLPAMTLTSLVLQCNNLVIEEVNMHAAMNTLTAWCMEHGNRLHAPYSDCMG